MAFVCIRRRKRSSPNMEKERAAAKATGGIEAGAGAAGGPLARQTASEDKGVEEEAAEAGAGSHYSSGRNKGAGVMQLALQAQPSHGGGHYWESRAWQQQQHRGPALG